MAHLFLTEALKAALTPEVSLVLILLDLPGAPGMLNHGITHMYSEHLLQRTLGLKKMLCYILMPSSHDSSLRPFILSYLHE